MGGPQCRLSILRNGNVPCRYFLDFPVDFKIAQCRLSIFRNDNVPCCYFSNVPGDFKVVQCRLSVLRKCSVTLLILRVKGPCSPLSEPHPHPTCIFLTIFSPPFRHVLPRCESREVSPNLAEVETPRVHHKQSPHYRVGFLFFHVPCGRGAELSCTCLTVYTHL